MMNKYSSFQNKKVFVTGHNGFKGKWLCSWLKLLGAKVYGFSRGNSYQFLDLPTTQTDVVKEYVGDVIDYSRLRDCIIDADPDVVYHLSAQPLVRQSYEEPLLTWNTNLNGTLNLLNACRSLKNIAAILVITTDKVYANDNNLRRPLNEDDPIGANDPYSSSKAAAELAVSSYRKSFFQDSSCPRLISLRAGNVIGGDDWSRDRLVPDAIKSRLTNTSIIVRNPGHVRPWQHVLDCLSGYLEIGSRILENPSQLKYDEWNFGPVSQPDVTVLDILNGLNNIWPGFDLDLSQSSSRLHEHKILSLDSRRSRTNLDWQPLLSLDKALSFTARWYQQWLENHTNIREDQIIYYNQLLGAIYNSTAGS